MTGRAYLRPTSLEAALRARSRGPTAPLAGGTDLVTLRADGQRPGVLLDLKHVAELRGAQAAGDTVAIGAATRLVDVCCLGHPGIDALVDGAAVVGSAQTRRRATLGGNICRSSPAGDTLPAVIALDAELEIASRGATRTVRATEFFQGPGRNVVGEHELLTRITVQACPHSAYQRRTYRRWMDLAVIGVAAALTIVDGVCTAARIAVGGAAPTPLLVEAAAEPLVGRPPADGAHDAGRAVAAAAAPISDVRGSADYRRDGLVSLTAAVITQAAGRRAPVTSAAPSTTVGGA